MGRKVGCINKALLVLPVIWYLAHMRISKKIFVLFALMVCATTFLHAQELMPDSTLHIVYWRNNMIDELQFPNRSPEKINRQQMVRFFYHLYADTSQTYEFVATNKKNPYRKKVIIGTDIRHHAIHQFIGKRETWSSIRYPLEDYKPLVGVLKDTMRTNQWIFKNDYRYILGYKCRLAVCIRSDQDSLLVWYTTALKGYGNLSYLNGLPGVALDMVFQKGDQHYFAVVIEKVKQQIGMPSSPKWISKEEWAEAIQRRRDELNRHGFIRVNR